jgi:hypothetical protein
VAGNAEDSRIDIGIVTEWRQFSLRFDLAVCVLRLLNGAKHRLTGRCKATVNAKSAVLWAGELFQEALRIASTSAFLLILLRPGISRFCARW